MVRVYSFVDGAYLRKLAEGRIEGFWNPLQLSLGVVGQLGYRDQNEARLVRVTYYDAEPDGEQQSDGKIKDYWERVELLNDTHLGFGTLRGKTRRRPQRQKGVDTLIAVDMLTNAFDRNYATALLVAGDADFVPVVDEVKRRGPRVIVAAEERSISPDLMRTADRFIALHPDANQGSGNGVFGLM